MAFDSWTERAAVLETEVYARYLASRDPRTRNAAKAVIALIVAYAVSPLDPIPAVVPGLGYLDELVVLPAGAAIALRLVPEDVMDESRRRAGEEIDVGRARWVVAAVVVLLWAPIGLAALRAVVVRV